MQNFGGQIRCIMGDVEVANSFLSRLLHVLLAMGIHGLGDFYYFILDEHLVLELYHHQHLLIISN